MTPEAFERAAASTPSDLADAYLLVLRLVEGGAFADLGVAVLFPGPVPWPVDATARLRERAESLTGAPSDLVDEVLRRLWGWPPRRSEP